MVSFLVAKLTHLSPVYVYVTVAALVFGETGLFIGFFLPGETAVIVGGFVASRGRVNIVVFIVIVVLAVVLGSSLGYLIGLRGGERLLRTRWMRRHEQALMRALEGLNRRGGTYVFLGRFAAFLRTVLPSLAGMSEMSFARFTVANVTSAMCWGPAYALLGYFAGAAYTNVERDSGWGALGFGVLVVGLVLFSWTRARRRRARDLGLDDDASATDQRAEPPAP
jgi:membrane protein DedA with SNARE-associated domain